MHPFPHPLIKTVPLSLKCSMTAHHLIAIPSRTRVTQLRPNSSSNSTLSTRQTTYCKQCNPHQPFTIIERCLCNNHPLRVAALTLYTLRSLHKSNSLQRFSLEVLQWTSRLTRRCNRNASHPPRTTTTTMVSKTLHRSSKVISTNLHQVVRLRRVSKC